MKGTLLYVHLDWKEIIHSNCKTASEKSSAKPQEAKKLRCEVCYCRNPKPEKEPHAESEAQHREFYGRWVRRNTAGFAQQQRSIRDLCGIFTAPMLTNAVRVMNIAQKKAPQLARCISNVDDEYSVTRRGLNKWQLRDLNNRPWKLMKIIAKKS